MPITTNPNFRDAELDEVLGLESGDVENIDRFNEPPAGVSLTDTPGQWAWERPPEISDPKVAAQAVIQQINDPDTSDELLKLMLSGVPLEAITNTISFGGFVEGKWSVDTSELIKPAVMLSLVGLAYENDIDATMFNTDPEKEKEKSMMPDEKVLRLMEKNRPDLYSRFMGVVDEILEEPEEMEEPEEQESSQGMLEPEGFMDMEEEEVA
jgi:hypothetical protein